MRARATHAAQRDFRLPLCWPVVQPAQISKPQLVYLAKRRPTLKLLRMSM
jgi:hypothetical protein